MPLRNLSDAGTAKLYLYHFPSPGEPSDAGVFPWIRNDYDPSQEDQLCSACSQLDVKYLLRHRNANSIVLGTVDEIQTRDCAFCHRFVNIISWSSPYAEAMVVSGNDIVELRSHPSRSHGWQNSEADEQLPFTFEFEIMQNVRTPENPLMISKAEASPVTELFDGPYNIPPLLSLRTVPDRFEVATLQTWLHECVCAPPNMSEISTVDDSQFLGFRCIDLIDECLVDVEVSVVFVALSYVWGSVPQSIVLLEDGIMQLRERNSISPTDTRFPKTIRDAMILCKELDIRYLWVDALCIIQDSPDKLQQIKWLHVIYQRALFTIVAAHGESAEAGLPGVGSTARLEHQQVSNIQGLRLAQKSLDLDIALLSSYWRTRAWTFQEYLLSPRKLIFTKHRIYFSCSHGVRTEDLRAPDHSSLARYGRKLYQSGLEFSLNDKLNWEIYADLVAAYTTKSMSYETDIIPAFTALAATLSREVFGSTPFVFGIPQCMLNAGLLWRRCIGCTECKNAEAGLKSRGLAPESNSAQHIPSWSWAGWIGHVHYSDWILQNDNPTTTIIPRVTWLSVRGTTGRDVPAEMTGKPRENWPRWTSWREKTQGSVKAFVQEGGNQNRLFCHPVETISSQSETTICQASGVLTFIGQVAEFVVYKRLYQGPGQRREKEAFGGQIGPAHGNPLIILNRAGSHVGLLYDDIDIHTIALTQQTRPFVLGSFIKMSQTTMSSDQKDDPAWNPETKQYDGVPGGQSVNPDAKPDFRKYYDYEKWGWNVPWGLYNVLLVREKDGAFYRLGVGKICAKAFDEANPETKIIMLA
jgi:Heterokaryon incompatibility protein (HET)